MKWIRIIIAAASGVLLIVSCAMMPQMLVSISQRVNTSRLQTRPISDIFYEVQRDEQKDTIRKLHILRNEGQIIYVTENMMQSSPAEISAAVDSYLSSFRNAGVLPMVGSTRLQTVQPVLLYDSDGKEYDLFWEIERKMKEEITGREMNIAVMMDDRYHRGFRFTYDLTPGYHDKGDFVVTEENAQVLGAIFIGLLGVRQTLVGNGENQTFTYMLNGDENLICTITVKEDGVAMTVGNPEHTN